MLFRHFSIALGVLVLNTSTTAQVLTLPEGTTGLTPLQGEIVDVQSVRIPLGEAVTGSETRVTLNFTLQGCLDSLMPLISSYETAQDQVNLYVTALNAHNQESIAATCMGMPEVSETISIPGIFDQEQINVTFLGHVASTPTAQKSYTNQRFGFHFDYPDNLALDSEKNTTTSTNLSLWPQDVYQEIQSGVYEGGTEYPPSISISVHKNPKQQSLVNWANSYQPGIQNIESIVIDGQTGIHYRADGLYPSENVAFYSPDNRQIILLNVSYLDRETSPLVQPFQDIVSSFHFIR